MPAVVQAFLNPSIYDHDVDSIELVETHISWVFLTGRFAYKVKKPVTLPFVDFGTLELRRKCCEQELRLNRRLAPCLYLDVVTLGGTPDAPKLGGTPAIEYAVKMLQFPSDARLDRALEAGRVNAERIEAFAEHIANFHAGAPTLPQDADEARPAELDTFRENLTQTLEQLDAPGQRRLEPIRRWFDTASETIAQTLLRRRGSGFVRDCHGDLHLENLVLLDGRIHAFDALEFNEALRHIDVIDEVAFLCMDLSSHRRRDLGFVFLNRYLEVSGDYAGLAVLRFYQIHRALVRAKVRTIAEQQSSDQAKNSAGAYLNCAESLCAPARPRLIIMRGLSGSGKTHVAQSLVPALPCISVRSDVERKRLFGLSAQAQSSSGLNTGIYDPAAGDATYAALQDAASAALAGGFDIIVDASFLSRSRRNAFRKLASERRADFVVLDCVAPVDVLRARIEKRRSQERDASEATAEVLDDQLTRAEDLDASEQDAAVIVDTNAPLNARDLIEKISELA